MSSTSTVESDKELPFSLYAQALRNRDDAAWRELTRRFTPRLIGLARQRLQQYGGRSLVAEVDPDEVVQSVYRTFDRRYRLLGQFQIHTWEGLWALLVVLTVRRCCKGLDYAHAQMRDIRLRAHLPDVPGESATPSANPAMLDRGPTAEEEAILNESLDQWLRKLDECQRRVIVLGMLGMPDAEIGRELGRTEYTVRKMRKECALSLLTALSGDEVKND